MRHPDRAVDVAGDELVAALEPPVEDFEHAARLLAGLARAVERDLIAARRGDDAEPPLDQREVLVEFAEQRGGEPVVVEGQNDLCRAVWRVGAIRHRSDGIADPGVRSSGSCAGERARAVRAKRAEQAVAADSRDRRRRRSSPIRTAAPSTCTGCR